MDSPYLLGVLVSLEVLSFLVVPIRYKSKHMSPIGQRLHQKHCLWIRLIIFWGLNICSVGLLAVGLNICFTENFLNLHAMLSVFISNKPPPGCLNSVTYNSYSFSLFSKWQSPRITTKHTGEPGGPSVPLSPAIPWKPWKSSKKNQKQQKCYNKWKGTK